MIFKDIVVTINSVQSLSIYTYIFSFDAHKHHILQIRKIELKEITGLAQGHSATKSKNQDQSLSPQNN